MWKKAKLMFLIAETPLHPGSGSGLGIIDLPIQRERHTNFPKIEGSSLKGCIRETYESLIKKEDGEDKINELKRMIEIVFGPEDGDQFASAVAFTDAKILLFPVKSLKGVFAWITCPFVLERFREDLSICYSDTQNNNLYGQIKNINFPELANSVCKESEVIISLNSQNRVVLEEFTFEVNEKDETTQLAKDLANAIFPSDKVYNFWREKLKKDLVVLPDDVFTDFVTYSTEVITRTKIDSKTGTVQAGALWTEEYVPQDTIFYSIITASDPKTPNKDSQTLKNADNIMNFLIFGLSNAVVQIGGNQTIGKGIVRVKI